jgi:general secretion pathway protein D
MKLKQACFLLAASLLPLSALSLRADDASDSVVSSHTEAVSRQQLAVQANQAIADGQRFLGSGNYDQAAERFQYALDALTPGGVAAVSYNRAEAGLAAAKAGQAQQLAKDYKFAQAADLLQESVALQPDNPVYAADIQDLKRQQMAYEEQIRDPEGTVNNPAVTDEFKDRVAAAQKLLFQGDAYFRTGQFDKAEDTYSKILILDPYNKAARDKMAHIERYKERAAGFRHEEYEQAKMEQVDHHWSEDISPDIVAVPTTSSTEVKMSNRAKIQHKLESIVIDKVNFEKLDIAAVIQFLQQKSKELDPDKEGINFVLRLNSDLVPAPTDPNAPAPAPGAAPAAPPPSIHREVSITLENVPLSEILSYIIQQTNLQFSVEDYAVYLRPSIDEGETLTVRTFLVPPGFFEGSTLRVTLAAATDSALSTVEGVSVDAQKTLADKGIRFPAGSSAIFLPGSSKLVVRDTPEQLDLVANLIDQQSNETPQIQIESKIAEFTEDAIKGLTFNYIISQGGTSNVGSIGSPINASTALRTPDYISTTGNGGLAPNSIDNLILSNAGSNNAFAFTYPIQGANGALVAPNVSNTLTIGGIVDGKGFLAIIDAINNLKGVSLVSAPSVTTQNGLKANIDIVREFPYPTSFEKPKLSNNSELVYPGTNFFGFFLTGTSPVGPLTLAVPPTPREFVTQDIGVSLEVKPTTYPDQRIDLDISKCQVLDFDGFIDYGVPIVSRLVEDSSADPRDSEGTVLTAGVINQPVFNLRSMVTNLQVLDGQTAILGGLLREDTQEVNDKVPVLGDVPLLGRLFQSKVTERTKKNLLIFVTARLIRTNGKPEYTKTLDAEPEEEALPEPEPINVPGASLPLLPEGTPNS